MDGTDIRTAIDSGLGNILGAERAEADRRMLSQAFIETSDLQALRRTDHFNFIVGRRGTGKTALFLRLIEELEQDKNVFLHHLKPEEHEALSLLGIVRASGNSTYDAVRASARVAWRTSLLLSLAKDLCDHWKFGSSAKAKWLRTYTGKHRSLLGINEIERCTQLVRACSAKCEAPDMLPGEVAQEFEVSRLQEEVVAALTELPASAVFLFDGLDEGWGPDQISVGLLGGLAAATSGFRDSGAPIKGQLFIRDNIFRSLAALDNDFSRHIEGSTIRLHWDEESLMNLVAGRLRVSLGMPGVENNNRVWNRFAHRELRDRAGFQMCLKHTLYRPRDILVLLNRAAVSAARTGRLGIVESDVEAASKQISLDRFADLVKEYRRVFPGLEHITQSFTGSAAFRSLGSVRASLDEFIAEEDYSTDAASDVALLGTSAQLVDALYSVGFLGLEEPATGAVLFCHDGALASISNMPDDRRVALHPCYWKALDVKDANVDTTVLLEIHDDYETRVNPGAVDIRIRRLGQLVTELPAVPAGREGAAAYEKWLLQSCKILFAGKLNNFQLHPAPGGVQRRDVVATNEATEGFWKRVLDDYQVRQVVFEAKNYEDLGADDFRQAYSYTGRQYGKLVLVVNRSLLEGLDQKQRGWIQEMWFQHNVLILTLPTGTLVRCLKKSRNALRRDYTDQQLGKRLDRFERSYLALQQGIRKRNRGPKKKRQ